MKLKLSETKELKEDFIPRSETVHVLATCLMVVVNEDTHLFCDEIITHPKLIEIKRNKNMVAMVYDTTLRKVIELDIMEIQKKVYTLNMQHQKD